MELCLKIKQFKSIAQQVEHYILLNYRFVKRLRVGQPVSRSVVVF